MMDDHATVHADPVIDSAVSQAVPVISQKPTTRPKKPRQPKAPATRKKRTVSATDFADTTRVRPSEGKKLRQPTYAFYYMCYLPSSAMQLPSAVVVARDVDEARSVILDQYKGIINQHEVEEVEARVLAASCQLLHLNNESAFDCTVARPITEVPPIQEETPQGLFVSTDFCVSHFGQSVALIMASTVKRAEEQMHALLRKVVGDFTHSPEHVFDVEGPIPATPRSCTWLVAPTM